MRVFLRSAVLIALLTLVTAGSASAATIAVTPDGTLLYTPGAEGSSIVSFDETAAETVRVRRLGGRNRFDGDPITPGTGCTDSSPRETPGVGFTCTGVKRVDADGGDGGDIFSARFVDGSRPGLETIPATLQGGPDTDVLQGGAARDTILGGAGRDTDLMGGGGDDVVDGGTGPDRIRDPSPDTGNDLLMGGEGDDEVAGAGGDDRVMGGPGDDRLEASVGNDEVAGGSGLDTYFSSSRSTVSLDDAANDTTADRPGTSNVRSDIEDVSASGDNDTVTGSAGPNSLTGGQGSDTIDGGAGNDVLAGGLGDDALRARDGFADLVVCGEGADTATVDEFDRVEECETVDVGTADGGQSSLEDRPPAVTFASPRSGAKLSGGRSTLTATATDDRGIAAVQFIDDERIVCNDTAAPYTCDYRPRGDDVGRNTLVVVAIDTSQQTTSATRAVLVDRFRPAGFSAKVAPARDTRAPFRFRTTGRLGLPAGVTAAQGCPGGVVSVQVKAGAKTISTRRVALRRSCTFVSTVTFSNRKRFGSTGRLRFVLRFTGNAVLSRSATLTRTLRTR